MTLSSTDEGVFTCAWHRYARQRNWLVGGVFWKNNFMQLWTMSSSSSWNGIF